MGTEWHIDTDRTRELLAQARHLARMGVWEMDLASGVYAWSEEVYEIHGMDPGKPPREAEWLALYTPESQRRIRAALRNCLDRHKSFEIEMELVDPLLLNVGQMLVAMRERQALTRSQGDLRLYAHVLENNPNAVAIVDHLNRIKAVNPAYEQISGYTREECLGKPPSLLRFRREQQSTHDDIWSQVARTGHWDGEVAAQRKDGQSFPARLSLNAVKDDHGDVVNYLLIVSDQSEQKAKEEAIQNARRFDALTGLGTRQVLVEEIEAKLESDAREPFTIAVLDLDGFRAFNESSGQSRGDSVLLRAAQHLLRCVRKNELLVRLGGDEFAVLFQGNSLDRVAELQRAVADAEDHAGERPSLTASVGFTCYPADPEPAGVLLRHAYQAMHEVKNLGGDGFGQFNLDAHQHQRQTRLKLKRLGQALQAEGFKLYFQPQLDLMTEQVIGAETLIRWEHPANGIIAPAHFLPTIAGQTLEIEVGEWVLRSAFAKLDEWRAEGLNLPLAINVSPAHLLDPGFLPLIRELLLDYPELPADRVQLEIVESAALRDMEAAASVMSTCRAEGVMLALDDFGAGYASLSYFDGCRWIWSRSTRTLSSTC